MLNAILNRVIFTFFCICCLISCSPETDSKSLNGLWVLENWIAVDSLGANSFPYGEDAIGQLTYFENGKMSLTLSANNRGKWGTFDHTAIDPQLVLDAFDYYFTYTGDYTIDWSNGIVEHHIEACLFPDWVGKTQKRHFELKNGDLYLRAYNKFGKDHELKWVKLD